MVDGVHESNEILGDPQVNEETVVENLTQSEFYINQNPFVSGNLLSTLNFKSPSSRPHPRDRLHNWEGVAAGAEGGRSSSPAGGRSPAGPAAVPGAGATEGPTPGAGESVPASGSA